VCAYILLFFYKIVHNDEFPEPIQFIFSLRALLPGDINENGIVDIFDAIMLANHFSQTPANPNWDAKVDLKADGIIDLFDAIILANHYNQHYP
jgi:hypothetical protein